MSEIKKDRVLYLTGDIDENLVKPIITSINEFNFEDSKRKLKEVDFTPQPIKLMIDTYGGSVYCGMNLVNTILTSETEIHGYVYGKAMSMGIPILQACHKKIGTKYSTLMIHDVSTKKLGTVETVMHDIKESKRLREMIIDIISENSKVRKSDIMPYIESSKDWFLSGKEAYDYGLFDELLSHTK